jgi:Rrf2 family protein
MLSQKTKYALRALLMLAEGPPEELVLIQDIADRQKVPRKFLELILLELKRHGFVHSQRGRGRPARSASGRSCGRWTGR